MLTHRTPSQWVSAACRAISKTWASSVFKICLYTYLASSTLFAQLALCEEPSKEPSKTPLAGEAFHLEMKGKEIDVPARTRRYQTAIDFGVQVIPQGPRTQQVTPYG